MVILIYLLGMLPAGAAENPPTQTVTNPLPPPAVTNEGQQVLEGKDMVVIGLISPELGPYSREGKEQRQAAEIAVEEINAAGGIMGKKVKLVIRDSKSNPRIAKENAIELFDKENAQMIFGGVSSAAALVTGKVARVREKIYFATSSFSSDITAEEGHKYIFRECLDSRMAAKVLSGYLNKNFSGKKLFFISPLITTGV